MIAFLTLDLHIEAAQSLKDKRQVVRSLKDRLRAHFNVAVAELDPSGLWNRATVGVVGISDSRDYLDGLMKNVERQATRIANNGGADITDSFVEFLYAPSGWRSSDWQLLFGKSQNYLAPIQHVFEFVACVLRFLGERKIKISGNRGRNRTFGKAFFVEFRFHDFTVCIGAAPLTTRRADPDAYPSLSINASPATRLSCYWVINGA